MEIFRLGSAAPAVRDIRGRLAKLGLLEAPRPGEPACYDDACERAVRTFQQQRGLSVDGRVGPETYRALEEASWQLGDRVLHYAVARPLVGDDVAALQRRLLDLGFDVGRCDGIFGARTDSALREFQTNWGLNPDGTFGPASMRAVRQLSRAVVGGKPGHLREHEALHQAGRRLSGKTVIVDPGHGAGDAGWVVGSLREADLVLDLAQRIEGRLAAAGANAFPTRSADGNPDVHDRAAFANAADADLFLSLHVDGAPSPRCHGVATYYFGTTDDAGSAVGERLAELVQNEVVARTDLLDCGTHAKTWEALRLTRMPAVRLEIGYLTNPSDATRLVQPAFRDTVAEAVLVAVQRLYLPAEEDPGTGQLRIPA
jgi:N-acetylmuramoyl-L-alanine amidase